ncbi:MAG: NAD(P)-binding domain-containing protein [Fibrobacterota bacterium]|nr:NAD(P)-binding domain-containing protein [Fibrobacterota bacterium]
MNILSADKLDALAINGLEASGFKVVQCKGLAAGNLPPEAAGAEILIVRSTLVPKDILPGMPALRLIIRAGAGTDTIDVKAAEARGIQVSNTPGKNADAVAEMALGLMLAADRKIAEGTQALRQGKWTKGALGQGMGLKGRTLGLVGFGAVARSMARNAKGMDMKVVAWSRSLTPEMAAAAGVGFAADLVALARVSDAVSIHVAYTPEARNLIGAAFFAALKPGALFVNTSRGEVVDRAALLDAIRSKGLRAGLDVFAGEPKVSEAPFEDADLAALCACTPHLGASTDQAAEAVAKEVVRIAAEYKRTGIAPNSVKI